MAKKIIVLVIALLPMFLTACYDREEIDNITYIIALGIDKGKKENLRLTMQYFTINEKSEGNVGNEETTSICIEASSIINAVNMVNNSIDRKLSFSHTKLIVISEELARTGNLKTILKPIENSREFRPNIYMAVSKQSAEKYLKTIEKLKKSNIARYYRLMFSSYEYSGYYMASPKDDFYYKLCDNDVGAYAPYIAVNELEKDEDIEKLIDAKEGSKKDVVRNGDFLAGDIPEKGKETKVQIMGIAVFNKDKMVGVMEGEEVTHFLMVIDEFKRSIYTIKDPIKKNNNINISLHKNNNPNIHVSFKDGKPKIRVDISLSGEYVYFESDVNYNNREKNAILVNYIQTAMATRTKELLNKTAREYKSDICLFAKQARKKYLTWQEWEKYNWRKKYEDAEFDVNVDVKIKMRGMIEQ